MKHALFSSPFLSLRRLCMGATFAAFLAAFLAVFLVGCAAPSVQEYAKERPVLDLRQYFNGPLTAHGIFTDRSGKVVKRFKVRMTGRWNGNEGVLDEHFDYSDGSTQQRVWRLTHLGEGRYSGKADDVVGEANGQTAGNAFHWNYVLALPVDGRVWNVSMDDWMYQMDDRIMLNRAAMSKFGVHLGDITLTFIKE
ncbi:DUF3833 domain-containing protein [Ottowia thiooxydans]|uniref:DUF3833 domain-containing protein n=1 Tax=Ottowia thiooxydans TaxID=219182 RepID=UPI000411BB1A|nr:DUF3833 domain-containing protein [Ottowia thiooxydans]